jgi:hypothetical protein
MSILDPSDLGDLTQSRLNTVRRWNQRHGCDLGDYEEIEYWDGSAAVV